jgi:hypothetical protein
MNFMNIFCFQCNDHCEENSIRDVDRLQILTKFWQNLYSTLIDLRAHALVILGCRIFDERQLIIIIHKVFLNKTNLSLILNLSVSCITLFHVKTRVIIKSEIFS